jgi:hypothetical protein
MPGRPPPGEATVRQVKAATDAEQGRGRNVKGKAATEDTEVTETTEEVEGKAWRSL